MARRKNSEPAKRLVLRPADVEPEIKVDLPPTSDGIVLSTKQEVNLDNQLPESGEIIVSGNAIPEPTISIDLPETGESNVLNRAVDNPAISPELPDVQESPVAGISTPSPPLPTDIPDVSDTNVLNVETDKPAISIDLPDAQDVPAINIPVHSEDMKSDLPDAQDVPAINIPVQSEDIKSELPESQDVLNINIPMRSEDIKPDLPDTQDAIVLSNLLSEPVIGTDLPDAQDTSTINIPEQSSELKSELPDAQDVLGVNIPVHSEEIKAELPDTNDSVVTGIVSEKPTISAELPESQDTLAVNIPEQSQKILIDLPDTSDKIILSAEVEKPEIKSELPDTQDILSTNIIKQSGDMKAELPDVQESTSANIPVRSEDMKADLPDTRDSIVLSVKEDKPVIDSELPDIQETPTVNVAPISKPLESELPDTSDKTVLYQEKELPAIQPELPETTSISVLHPEIDKPTIGQELPEISEKQVLRPIQEFPSISSELPQISDDGRDQRKEFSFSKGHWLPKGDPLNIGVENFEQLENLRPTDFGLEGVGGSTKINTSSVGAKITNGIQLKTNYTKTSYILAQVGNNAAVIQNQSTIPNTGNFITYSAFYVTLGVNDKLVLKSTVGAIDNQSTLTIPASTYSTGALLASSIETAMNLDGFLTHSSTLTFTCTYGTTPNKFTITCTVGGGTIKYIDSGSTIGDTIGFTTDTVAVVSTITSDTAVTNDTALYTEESGASQGRFAQLPNGNVGFCDQKANRIWAGEEMPVGSFWTGTFSTVTITLNSTDIMIFTSDLGSASLGVAAGTYTYDELAVQLAANMNGSSSEGHTINGNHTITFTVTNQMGKFKIDAGTGHTIAFTHSGSTAYARFGFTNDLSAAQTITGDEFASSGNNIPYFNPAKMEDVTKKIQNTATDSDNIVTLGNTASDKFYLVGTTRPISGINHTIVSGTLNASVLTVKYCDGKKFVTVGTITDGATAGHVTFTSTVDLAKPLYVNGYYLYFYLCELSSGTPVISHVTVNAPIQNYVNLWDGISRTAIKCELFTTKYTDYTLQIANDAELTAAAVVQYDFMLTGAANTITLMFEEQITALLIKLSQVTIGTDEGYLKVTYTKNNSTTGTAFVYLNTTSSLYVPLKQGNGAVAWEKPTDEEPTYYKGVKGYKYTLVWYAKNSTSQFTFSGTAINCPVINTITGIPSYQTIVKPYIFPFQYRNRSMLCGSVSDGEKNRVDYSPTNSPDCYNGDESSMYDNSQSLRFGGKEALTGAVELYNLYGDSTISNASFFKNNETYLLTGDSPSADSTTPFKIHQISGLIGCPAPLTIDVAEVSVGNQAGVPQNVAVWLSDKGPMIFGGNAIQPLLGLDPYFEDGNALCINKTYIANSRGCYDPTYKAYHLFLPSTSSTGTLDLWFACDMQRLRWYQITPTTEFPQGAFLVQDNVGNKYLYGYTAAGYLLRLEADVQYWISDTYPIINVVKTADILPTGSVWDTTLMRRIKTMFVCDTAGHITITHYLDGDSTGTVISRTIAGGVVTQTYNVMTAVTAGERYRNLITQAFKTVSSVNYGAIGLSHAFKFQITTPADKPKLLGWGMQYLPLYEDTQDEA